MSGFIPSVQPPLQYYKSTFILLIFSLLLSACAVQPPVSDLQRTDYWTSHKKTISALQSWTLNGRFSLQMEQEAWSASLYWLQKMDEFRLRIIAPFGRGTVQISGNKETVVLQTAENEIFEADDVDLLIRQNLGWNIPVASLAYWIKGLPEPDTEVQTLVLDDTGRASDLRQSGWSVSFERYTNDSGYALPTRVTLQHEGLRLRLIINNWEISS